MKIFNILFKCAVCVLVLIVLEGVFSLGKAYDFTQYNWVGVVVQMCLLIITFRIAFEDWGD